MDILGTLYSHTDEGYKKFQSSLIPNIDKAKIIGVRMPDIKKLAKQILKSGEEREIGEFLSSLPHAYYEQDLLQGQLISLEKDYHICIKNLEIFLPYVDNWAVCDSISPKVFKQNRSKLIAKVKGWIASNHPYTCRFGIKTLMDHYLEGDFDESYLALPANVNSGGYYVNMAKAWFFATALAKRWDETLPYISGKKLDKWTHNKTIQKAIESYRIPHEKKEQLKKLRLNAGSVN